MGIGFWGEGGDREREGEGERKWMMQSEKLRGGEVFWRMLLRERVLKHEGILSFILLLK